MLKNRLFGFFLVCSGMLLVFSSVIFSQTAPVRGVVKVLVDGKQVPVDDALVVPVRVDIETGKAASTKTNANGEFNFAGFAPGQKYVLSVSGAKISPAITAPVEGGMESIVVLVYPGDGKALTESEVRAAAKKSPQGVSTAREEDRAKLEAEYEKEKARVAENNKKAENINKIVSVAIKEGGDAFASKNYDLAIQKYDEGLAADPEFIGSAPVFLSNKSRVLTVQAVDNYNKGVKEADVAAKTAAMAKVKKGLADAADSLLKAWKILKKPTTDAQERTAAETNKVAVLRGAADTFGLSVKTKQVDPALVEAAKLLMPEYLAFETDAKKKADASIVIADLYRIVEDRENAIVAYKKALETSPNNVDAMAYLGIVLVDLGWIKDNDKALSQEGANYLQQFVAAAPDSHELKTGAVEYLNILKTQNIVPVKSTTPRKRP